jgi:hypothetical protein
MKIRWKNTLIRPQTDSRWMHFTCKYPALFFIPSIGMFVNSYYFWQIITEMEEGKRASVWVGKLKLMYDIFGKWGIVGFMLLVAFCFLYLFWVYAISKPSNKI